ncbi:MAG: LysR family transcriptional regulator [Candidatus Competibacteraceae bacterium]|nr:LysR family transcriptional regulator [Candidatus Competibacteraceae bacterium]
MIEWDDYRYFLAVEQAGSVLAAARRLGVNHTTVLRRIASLEKRLGVRLFERLRTGYTPTATGEELREVIARLQQTLLAAEHRLSGKDLQLSGVVRIATTDTLSTGLLLPHLAAFWQRHPRIQLQIIGSNQLVNLTRRDADVAIRATNQPPDNLLGRKIGVARSAIYAAPRYLEARGYDLTSNRHHWIGLDETLAHLPEYRWLERRVAPERIALRLSNLLHKIEVVKAGHGIAPLLCFLAERAPGLIRLTEPEPLFDTDIWLLGHPDLRQVARVRAVMAFITECAAADKLLQGGLSKRLMANNPE